MINIVVGLQYGDEGKGKVVNHLAQLNKYDYCIRYNGGANAGHTIYKDGVKIITHQVPTGAVHNIQCIIGDNCYVDISKLVKELDYLLSKNVYITQLYVSKKAHLITKDHLEKDSTDRDIGTTKSGIGPCATSKYSRNGKRVGDLLNENILIDKRIIICDAYSLIKTYHEVYHKYPDILVEGAQGFGLDITHGDYPYVTSSHCIATDCLNMGIPLVDNKMIIYGVCKCYETYVGNKLFQSNDEILTKIQILGGEKGATTGRDRQVNYLNIDYLCKSIWINNVTYVIINKYDILTKLGIYKLYKNEKLLEFSTFDSFKEWINTQIVSSVPWIKDTDIIWSCNPKTI